MESEKPHIRRFSIFPKTVAQVIEPIIKPIYKKHGFAEHRILTEWESVVGKELSTCSVPQKLNRKTLHVLTASGRALELQHMQPIILDRIATYFGYRAVERITLLQTSSGLLRKAISVKSTGKLQETVENFSLPAPCEDEDLRRALLALAGAIRACHAES